MELLARLAMLPAGDGVDDRPEAEGPASRPQGQTESQLVLLTMAAFLNLALGMDSDTKSNIVHMEGKGYCVPAALLPLLRGLSGGASLLPRALAPGRL